MFEDGERPERKVVTNALFARVRLEWHSLTSPSPTLRHLGNVKGEPERH